MTGDMPGTGGHAWLLDQMYGPVTYHEGCYRTGPQYLKD